MQPPAVARVAAWEATRGCCHSGRAVRPRSGRKGRRAPAGRRLQVGKQRAFLNNLASCQIHQDGVLLHQGQFPRANTPYRCVREGDRDDQHVCRLEQHVELLRGANPVRRCGGAASPVDGVNLHSYCPHESCRGDPDPPEPENAADPAGQHAVRRKLIEGPGSSWRCSRKSRLAAARVRASPCSAIGSADAPLFLAIGRSAGKACKGIKSIPAV
jgi:hypothetical protein